MIITHTFDTRVRLPASWMGSSREAIDREIRQQIQRRYGGRCNDVGYVYGDTIMVTGRGRGEVDDVECDGGVVYDVVFVASVCRLEENDELRCVVVDKNQEGIRCRSSDPTDTTPLDIIMPIRWHTPAVRRELDKCSKGDELVTRVLGCRFAAGDTSLSVIVEFAGRPPRS